MILENYVSVNSENESFEENKKSSYLFYKTNSVCFKRKDITENISKKKICLSWENKQTYEFIREATICSVFVVFLRTFLCKFLKERVVESDCSLPVQLNTLSRLGYFNFCPHIRLEFRKKARSFLSLINFHTCSVKILHFWSLPHGPSTRRGAGRSKRYKNRFLTNSSSMEILLRFNFSIFLTVQTYVCLTKTLEFFSHTDLPYRNSVFDWSVQFTEKKSCAIFVIIRSSNTWNCEYFVCSFAFFYTFFSPQRCVV